MPMRFPLLAAPFLFFGFVILEIAVFIYLGEKIGILPVLALVLLSAFSGAALARGSKNFFFSIGGSAFSLRRAKAEAGRRLFSFIAALLLIVPGLISSCLGLILALPPVQDALAARLKKSGGFKTVFSFSGEMRETGGTGKRGGSSESPAADLKAENCHAADPENSPWRKP